jgi:hypothetical protein
MIGLAVGNTRCRAAVAFAQARCKRFLTSIKIWMVSALRLAWQREMVSRPPEKTCSTATAEPRCEDDMSKFCKYARMTHQVYIKCHKQGETSLGTELVDPSTVGIWMYSWHQYSGARVRHNVSYLHSSEAMLQVYK